MTRRNGGGGRRGPLASMMLMVQDMPLETRRRIMTQMMFGVPMMAAAAASFGTPAIYVAPMAAVIPSFMFAAFHDVHGNRVGDVDQADQNDDEDDDEDDDTTRRNNNRNRNRNGMSMIMRAIRVFQGNLGHRNAHGGRRGRKVA